MASGAPMLDSMSTMVDRMRSEALHVKRDAPRAGLWQRVLMITVVFAIIATACGGGGTTTTEAAAEPAGDAPATTAEVASEPAVDPDSANARLTGSFETFGGEAIDLATVQDSDVVLWLWAPW